MYVENTIMHNKIKTFDREIFTYLLKKFYMIISVLGGERQK